MDLLLAIGGPLLSFLFVVAFGLPLVARLADAQLRRRTFRDTYDPSVRSVITANSTIEPIDLGPDLLIWPSESDQIRPYVEKLTWPSESWDDPVFGRSAATAAAEAARDRAEEVRSATSTQRRQERADAAQASVLRAKQPRMSPRETSTASPHFNERPRPSEVGPRLPDMRRPPTAAPDASDDFFDLEAREVLVTTGAILSDEAVRAMVRERGLAGAVAEIGRRTGKDLDDITRMILEARR